MSSVRFTVVQVQQNCILCFELYVPLLSWIQVHDYTYVIFKHSNVIINIIFGTKIRITLVKCMISYNITRIIKQYFFTPGKSKMHHLGTYNCSYLNVKAFISESNLCQCLSKFTWNIVFTLCIMMCLIMFSVVDMA